MRRGITANRERLETGVRNSVGIVTALSPELGYAISAVIAKHSLATGIPLRDIVINRGLMTAEHVDALRSPAALIGLAAPTGNREHPAVHDGGVLTSPPG